MNKIPHIDPVSDLNPEQRELLRLLALGEKEIAEGKGYSARSVFRESDEFLKNE